MNATTPNQTDAGLVSRYGRRAFQWQDHATLDAVLDMLQREREGKRENDAELRLRRQRY
jgi:hypothetical protein